MRILFSLIFLWVTTTAWAQIPTWKIVPDQSNIIFTATQNNAPISGKFNTFAGEIHFDANQLNESKAHIMVDISSINTSYQAIADTLKTADWFDVKNFPKAEFKTNKIAKLNSNKYQVDGSLTILNKSKPQSLSFELVENTKDKVKIQGNFSIKRTDFGIGKGEWSGTDEVADEVKVNFTFVLIPVALALS